MAAPEPRTLLCDTTALIDLYRGKDWVRSYLERLIDGSLQGYVSVITEAELWRGLRVHEVETHEALLSYFAALPVSSAAARLAGLWMQHYEHQGLGWMDALIVATAKEAGLSVLTRDKPLATCLAAEASFERYGVEP